MESRQCVCLSFFRSLNADGARHSVNDCGKWINNVGNGQRFEGTYYIPGQPQAPQFEAVGSCDVWNVRFLFGVFWASSSLTWSFTQDWENYTAEMKAGLMLVASAHMDALRVR